MWRIELRALDSEKLGRSPLGRLLAASITYRSYRGSGGLIAEERDQRHPAREARERVKAASPGTLRGGPMDSLVTAGVTPTPCATAFLSADDLSVTLPHDWSSDFASYGSGIGLDRYVCY